MKYGYVFRQNSLPLGSLRCVRPTWLFSSTQHELTQNKALHGFWLWDVSQMRSALEIIIIFEVKLGGEVGTQGHSLASTFSAPSLLTHLQSRFNWGVITCKEQTKYWRPAARGWRGWGEQRKSEPWLVGRSQHAAQTSPIPVKTQCLKPKGRCKKKTTKAEPKARATAISVLQACAEIQAVGEQFGLSKISIRRFSASHMMPLHLFISHPQVKTMAKCNGRLLRRGITQFCQHQSYRLESTPQR